MAFCLRAVTNWHDMGVARAQKEIQSYWLRESEGRLLQQLESEREFTEGEALIMHISI